MFDKNDIAQIRKKRISPDTVERQIGDFIRGFPPLRIIRPASIGDGIRSFPSDVIGLEIREFEAALASRRLMKFVPASGAATRMFRDLFEYIQTSETSGRNVGKVPLTETLWMFFDNITEFAFYDELAGRLREKGLDIRELISQKKFAEIISCFLNSSGMDYGSLPKGLLMFHRYSSGPKTPVEEHLVEGAGYARNADNSVEIHFTVSREHKDAFIAHVSGVKSRYEKLFGVRYDVTFSEQDPSTDIIAVNPDNSPFREPDGRLLFRPGGHGALLSNMDRFDRDCNFIKNIDNVAVEETLETTVRYKKILAAVLFEVQSKIFGYLRALEKGFDESLISGIKNFYQTEMCTVFPEGYSSWANKDRSEYLASRLNRPVRACGMVKSEGKPGGGPFWAVNPDGSVSLQIVEASQVDLNDPEMRSLFSASTHFNPVDLAVGTRDVNGRKFNLLKFQDPATGFIGEKSWNGKKLKAQELPGLWNGSMSDWNTVFVDVPLKTFNPVKSVMDLLEPNHRTAL